MGDLFARRLILSLLKAAKEGRFFFRGFDGKGSYIPIINENAKRVVIIHNGDRGFGILSFENCKYIDVRGNNNPGYTYGIAVINDGTPYTPVGNIWVYGKSDHIKLGYMETYHTGSASGYDSVGIKVQDPSLTSAWTFSTFEIHHNYIHDTRYSGMYLGHNRPDYTGTDQECADGCPYVANFSIHDNRLENLGAYGFNYKGVRSGSTNNHIYNNTIKVNGLIFSGEDSFKDGISLSYFYGTAYAEVYNNWVEKTVGPGLHLREANHIVHDNLILGCGAGNSDSWGHGIVLSKSDYMPSRPARTVKLYENILVESKRYGIVALDRASGYHYRNIIAESGIGEAFSYGTLTEGEGVNANIYEPDADDVGFTRWIDDRDYSNDDFSLTGIPPATSLRILN